MLAFVVSHRKLKAVRKPLPPLRTGWAMLRVRMAGICSTDVGILRGYRNFRGTPGHEFVGEVAEVAVVSKEVKERWMDRRVAGEINVACAAYGVEPVCAFCARGIKAHCERRTALGIVAQDGAFAEYVALPLENLRAIPDGVSDEKAVFIEPLAAACRILEQIDVARYGSAAVLGDGKLGQLIARVLRVAGGTVVMYGKHNAKLAMAKKVGIETRRVWGGASDLKRVKERYRLVVEATGSPTGLRLAQEMTEPRGTLVLKSTFHGAAPVETWPLVVKEINVVGSRCGPFDKAIALLRAGEVDPAPLISREFPLRDAQQAILYAQKRGVMKVVLRNRGTTSG